MSDESVGIDTEASALGQSDDQKAERPLSNAENKTSADPNGLKAAETYLSGAPGQAPQGSLPGLAGFAQMQGLAPTAPPAQPEPPTLQPSQPEPLAYDPVPEPPELAQPEFEPFTPVAEQVPPADFGGSLEPSAPFLDELPTPSLDDSQTPPEVPPLPGMDQAEQSDDPFFAIQPRADNDAGHQTSDKAPSDGMGAFGAPLDAEVVEADATVVPPLPDGHEPFGGELQAFEAHYDQHPEIPIGAFDAGPGAEPGAHAYFQDQDGDDAEFLENEMSPENMPIGKRRPGRKLVMVSGSLAGALVLGGAIAFAYKQTGDPAADGSQPPLIQADSRPVKVAPKQPGGKQFPHKNKLIYDRLVGEERPEVEKVVPRQEEVADTAGTAASAAASTQDRPGRVAVAGLRQGTDAANPGAVSVATDATDGPRKVKTLVVRPDGTIVRPETPAPVNTAVVQGPAKTRGVAVTVPETPAKVEQPAQVQPEPAQPETPSPVAVPSATGAEQRIAAVQTQQSAPSAQPAFVAPTPTPKPKPRARQPQEQQTAAAAAPAAAAAAPATGASGSGYVVQVAARKSQTDALAAFADLQQRYPKLLSGYRPMIQRADLGDKGTWYRLRVGPMNEKTAATKLCKRLRSAGLRSCLVRSQ
ncbi:MAG: SPOR domain-containing protein [Methyloligellaceae bacterium]